MASYDQIGIGYSATRQDDPRVAAALQAGLASARSVLNVGAGTGSYEPLDRAVVAVEPSRRMIEQRASAAPVLQATSEALPLADDSFDAALGVLTIHHWRDVQRGLAELRRVARRVVLLTWDPEFEGDLWIVRDYFPAFGAEDDERFPTMAALDHALGGVEVTPVPVPADCLDGFLGAFWRRPAAYLDERVRRGISSFAAAEPVSLQAGLERLSADLESGRWAERYASLLELDALDVGYRRVVAVRS